MQRLALGARPEILLCEQVPQVLPIWRAIGTRLAEVGYSWWAGIMAAERFGVPQTRDRAILIARRDGLSPLPPEPTHREYVKGVPQSEGDPSLLPWVSMADALGWGMVARPWVTLPGANDGGGAHGGMGGAGARRTVYGERDAGRWVVDLRQSSPGPNGPHLKTRPIDDPAPTFGTKSGEQWVLRDRQPNGAERRQDEPAPTVLASADNGNKAWHATRPATTVRADDRIPPPGHHSGPQMDGAIKLTVEQALTLQSFPADFVLAGTKTAKFRLIGNAVAPLFARTLLAHVLDLDTAAVAS